MSTSKHTIEIGINIDDLDFRVAEAHVKRLKNALHGLNEEISLLASVSSADALKPLFAIIGNSLCADDLKRALDGVVRLTRIMDYDAGKGYVEEVTDKIRQVAESAIKSTTEKEQPE